ncbi:MAG: putative motility protein [Clostridiaceae bacterium]|nr:putative motility protein [Clostridiaceae bacterium]
MDIAAASMVLSQAKVQQQVSLSVMKMTMDTSKEKADFLTQMLNQAKLMEQSVNPHLGNRIDLKV